MSFRPIQKATTDVSVIVRVVDSGDGTPETAVAYNTAGVDLWYRRDGAAEVSITEVTQTITGAHSDGGFVHISDGYCRLDLPDLACATGVDGVMVGGTFTGMVVIGCYIPLVDYDPYDAVRAGLTALPNAAADAAGGLPISDAGGLDLDTQIGTDIDAILTTVNHGTHGNAAIETLVDEVEGYVDALEGALGALDDAAAAGQVTASDTLMAYMKQLINILIGTPGIAAWPAEAAPGNAVSMAEALRAIYLDTVGLAGDGMRGTDGANTTTPPTVGEIQAEMEANGASVLDTIRDAIENGTYGLSAIRTRGDAAWVTGGGGAISQVLNVQPLIPNSIDLANTATVRLGLALVNSVDDLPSTAEITPGTISIERKAIGGTSWSAVVTNAALSEIAGMVYYDEVFDSGSTYAEGDTLRFTFKSISITADANTFEVCGATGLMFYTSIRQTMVGTDDAATAAALTTAQNDLDILTGADGVILNTTQTNYAPNTVVPDAAGVAPTASEIQTEMEANGASVLDTIRDHIEHGTYGLSALETLVDEIEGYVDTIEGALGALDDAAAAGQVTASDTAMAYIKQLINILIGTAGIGTFPAEAAPANAVSLAEVIHAIHDDVTAINGDAMRGTDSALTDKTGFALSAAGNEAIWEVASGDAGHTFTDLMQIMAAALAGKLSVSGTTVTVRNLADDRNVLTITVDAVTEERTASVQNPAG